VRAGALERISTFLNGYKKSMILGLAEGDRDQWEGEHELKRTDI
jgi:hypothetical protein